MKTLKLAFIITLFSVFGRDHLYCQITDWDTTYMTTVLYDNFSTNQLDLNQWSVEDNSYSFNGVIIDSSATVSVNSGNLKLSVISCRDCSRAGETRDLAGGEIISNESFQYGIFECSAKINISEASLPIFSFIGGNGNDCANGNYYASEVDIFQVVEPYIIPVELQQRIYHHHPGTDCKLDFTSVNLNSEQIETSLNDFFDSYHTYKCIWTPNYIRYYVDGDLKHEVTNTGAECDECNQNWFPTYSSNVHLCNKVGGNMNYTNFSSTYFDKVSVKRFFATPEITVPSLICTTGSALMDVDQDADSITWVISPSNLFSGNTSGTGKTAAITAATGASGQAKITYTFKMPSVISGEIFTAEKTFWVGKPGTFDVSDFDEFIINSADGGDWYVCTDQAGNEFDLSYYRTSSMCTNFEIKITNLNNTVTYDHFYSTYGVGDLDYPNLQEGWYLIWARGYNSCGWGDWTESELEFVECSQMLLLFSPNPTIGETILSIESTSEETTFDETTEWDLEIYDQAQSLKEKKIRLKGKEHKIQTAGWKEGVYAVRVKYKEEILLGKLVVKK